MPTLYSHPHRGFSTALCALNVQLQLRSCSSLPAVNPGLQHSGLNLIRVETPLTTQGQDLRDSWHHFLQDHARSLGGWGVLRKAEIRLFRTTASSSSHSVSVLTDRPGVWGFYLEVPRLTLAPATPTIITMLRLLSASIVQSNLKHMRNLVWNSHAVSWPELLTDDITVFSHCLIKENLLVFF